MRWSFLIESVRTFIFSREKHHRKLEREMSQDSKYIASRQLLSLNHWIYCACPSSNWCSSEEDSDPRVLPL